MGTSTHIISSVPISTIRKYLPIALNNCVPEPELSSRIQTSLQVALAETIAEGEFQLTWLMKHGAIAIE